MDGSGAAAEAVQSLCCVGLRVSAEAARAGAGAGEPTLEVSHATDTEEARGLVSFQGAPGLDRSREDLEAFYLCPKDLWWHLGPAGLFPCRWLQV